MNKENINELIITGFKTLTYGLLLFTFMFVMKKVNYALAEPTRTAIVTAASFIVVLLLMQQIYGNFEIGFKKSKPVFLTTMISVLISTTIATLAMIVMGLEQFPLPSILLKTIPFYILTFGLQGMVIWFMAHIGNELFFKLYEPSKTLIINNNQDLFEKVNQYLTTHDKQYKIVNSVNEYNVNILLENEIDTIYALGMSGTNLSELISYCYKKNIHLNYDVDFIDILHGKKDTFVIDDVLMIEIAPIKITLVQLFVKRVMDIVGALVLLILSMPIYIIIGISIKKEDGGPIFFEQDRLTKDGKVFKILKFRSMKLNAGAKPVTENDDRITKVGHIIRKLRIDELPQAINILKGDISLVGPRPESEAHAETIRKEVPDFDLRLKVKGGLTGYAQIFGKYNTTPEMKLLLDLKYIKNFSTVEDIRLLFQTLMVFIRSDSTEAFSE